MSVTWECNRCAMKFKDKAAMVSHPPKDWQALQLVRIVKENLQDFDANVIDVAHVCSHCIGVIQTQAPEIKIF